MQFNSKEDSFFFFFFFSRGTYRSLWRRGNVQGGEEWVLHGGCFCGDRTLFQFLLSLPSALLSIWVFFPQTSSPVNTPPPRIQLGRQKHLRGWRTCKSETCSVDSYCTSFHFSNVVGVTIHLMVKRTRGEINRIYLQFLRKGQLTLLNATNRKERRTFYFHPLKRIKRIRS